MSNNIKNNMPVKTDRKRKKDRIFTAIRIIISISLLTFFIIRSWSSLKNFTSILRELNPAFLLLAVSFFILGIITEMLRWDTLLRAQDIRISKGYLTQSFFIAYFFSNIFPTNIGGDIYRAYDLHKNKDIPLDKNISVIVVDRFIGMFTGSIYLAISFFGVYRYLNLPTIISLSILPAGGLLLFFIILKPKVFKIDRLFKKIHFLTRFEPKYNSFLNHFVSYKHKLRYLALSSLFSFAAQVLFYTGFYFAAVYINLNLPFSAFLFLIPVIILITNVPISIGGIGVRENSFVILLKNFNVPEATGAFYALVALFVIIFSALLGGLIYLIKNIFYRSKGVL
ncbi:MAG: lysylphosphatidylglycerol synthase transmembrane domain-containing protein [Actinomycetota bacterium]|nr:lysylphosphatidylglycerol synthase transmembrane domain-containing protein [Actinomycetota bacterium]